MEEQYTEGCSEESCAGCSHSGSCESQKQNAGNTAPSKAPANVGSQVKKVIGVISGKGGVGKSLVTASLARMMIEKGYTAGILDADITGPSIPKMYGVHEMAIGNEMGMLPCSAPDGTRIMSVNLLLEEEDTPVIWRGPVIAGVVTQFWSDVMWGDLDYLFSRNGRCSVDCISVPACGWSCDRHLSAGSGTADRKEGVQHGKTDEHSGSWNRGKLQLHQMSGLRKRDQSVR